MMGHSYPLHGLPRYTPQPLLYAPSPKLVARVSSWFIGGPPFIPVLALCTYIVVIQGPSGCTYTNSVRLLFRMRTLYQIHLEDRARPRKTEGTFSLTMLRVLGSYMSAALDQQAGNSRCGSNGEVIKDAVANNEHCDGGGRKETGLHGCTSHSSALDTIGRQM